MIILHEPMPFTPGLDCLQFVAGILGVIHDVSAQNFVILFFLFLFLGKLLNHNFDSAPVDG